MRENESQIKNIQCNKESISTSNAYSDESKKNTEHITITIGRDTKISRSYQTKIEHSKTLTKYNTNAQQ